MIILWFLFIICIFDLSIKKKNDRGGKKWGYLVNDYYITIYDYVYSI